MVAPARSALAGGLFSFPDPVNEVSARLVAGGVVLMSLAAIVSGERWLTLVIAYGFVARVLTGPTLSPLGQIVTRFITPRLGVPARPVPGPPKRFAQGMGVVFSVTAAIVAFRFGMHLAADAVLALLIFAATLESVFAICLGCKVFAVLMRAGVIPESVCERCNDIWSTPAEAGVAGRPADVAAPAIRPVRWQLGALAVLGAGLILAPVAFQMFARAPKGATMIAGFRPYMTTARLAGFQTDLQRIDAGVRQADTAVAATLTQLPAASAAAPFRAGYPTFAAFDAQWPGIDADMSGMLDTIQANQGNYRAVAALPNFRLFPWFFVAPGVLLLVLAGVALIRPRRRRALRAAVVVLGVGLVLAPVAFQMFQRAPKGERMVNAFKTIETTKRVETIQGYFGDISVGQGAIRLELVPALRHAGLTNGQIAARFPAVAALDRDWIHILNDLTPMVGAMSDNIGNYQAVASLPPFSLFPWFFVIPGLLAIGLAVLPSAGSSSTERWRRDDSTASGTQS